MYSARATKSAADTYTATKAGPSTDSTSRGTSYSAGATPGTAYGNSSQGYSGTPTYRPPVTPAPAPTTTVTNNYSGSGDSSALTNMALGYMIGHSTSRHDTVVVQQPAPQSSAYGSSPDASTQTTNGGDHLSLPGPAVSPVASSAGGFIMRAIGWVIGLGILVAVAVKLFKAWSERKDKYSQKTNYRF